MRYAGVAYKEHLREQSFRVYLTDSVRLACENTAKIGGGSLISKRWADIIESQNKGAHAHDTRSPEEIIADVVEKAGLTIQ